MVIREPFSSTLRCPWTGRYPLIPSVLEPLAIAINQIPGLTTIRGTDRPEPAGPEIVLLADVNGSGVEGIAHVMAGVARVNRKLAKRAGQASVELWHQLLGDNDAVAQICYRLRPGDKKRRQTLVNFLNQPLSRRA